MQTDRDPHPTCSILAVVVLYKCELFRSESFRSLFQILNENPDLARHFSVVIYDNSPQPQNLPPPDQFTLHYIHDAANGGLASAYNFALARAESEQRQWLLLLDQDTSPTREFLLELTETAAAVYATPAVAAIVPKLVVHGIIHSPATHFIEQMRHQFQTAKEPMGEEVVGVQQQSWCAYNSGSTLRVSALRSIGGFPLEFWLDFLDHAVFHALYVQGFRMYVLRSTLVHEASHSDIGSVPVWRLHNVLMAQTLYVKRSGNFMDRLLYRIWLLRNGRNLRKGCKDPRMWRETVLQAFLMRVPKSRGLTPPRARGRGNISVC